MDASNKTAFQTVMLMLIGTHRDYGAHIQCLPRFQTDGISIPKEGSGHVVQHLTEKLFSVDSS